MFPKPIKKTKKERSIARKQRARTIDEAYIKWIHGWTCCVPGCVVYPVHAHHAKRKSQLGSDRTCVPLCYDHHVGVCGIHPMGILTFSRKYRMDLDKIILEFNRRYDAGEVGPNHGLLGQ